MGLNDVKISTLTNLKLFNRLFKQKWLFGNVINYPHCVKIVQIRSFFWFVFSRIRTEYGEILRISLYSIQMRQNTDQQKLRYLDTFHAVPALLSFFCKMNLSPIWIGGVRGILLPLTKDFSTDQCFTIRSWIIQFRN